MHVSLKDKGNLVFINEISNQILICLINKNNTLQKWITKNRKQIQIIIPFHSVAHFNRVINFSKYPNYL